MPPAALGLRAAPLITDAAGPRRGVAQPAILELLENNIGDAALGRLKPLGQLRLLDLRGCKAVTDAGLARLSTITSLRALRLGSPAIGDAGLARLAGLKNLAELSVEGSLAVTAKGLNVLENFPAMTSLRLSYSPGVDDAGLAALANMPSLRLLFLRQPASRGVPEHVAMPATWNGSICR